MPRALAEYRLVLGTTLRGLAERRGLAFASWVLTTIAVASAIVGTSYQETSANSFVVTQLRAEPRVGTGLSYTYRPTGRPGLTSAISTAVAAAEDVSGPAYAGGHAMVWQKLTPVSFPHALDPATPTLLFAPGDCTHVGLEGRCPRRAGEVAVSADDAYTYSLRVGTVVRAYPDTPPFRVVGIYTPRHNASDFAFWFDSEQLRAVPGRLLTIPSSNTIPVTLLAPWFTTRSEIERRSASWFVSVDQELEVPATLTPADLTRTSARAKAVTVRSAAGDLPRDLTLEPGNSLPTLSHTLLARRSVARSTVTPAVMSLILVALVLLSRLLSAAMDLRRGELALASLRGYGRRRLWVLGLTEPLLILLAAAPVGVLLGQLAAVALAREWLVSGLPVPFVRASCLSAAAVVLATAAVMVGVVRVAVSEPLSAQIAGERRPRRPGRVILVVRLGLLAAAAAALAIAWSRSHPTAPDATDLALPLLLATGVGLLTSLGILVLASLWIRWSVRRRSLPSYVASRSVRRRHQGTQVILPVTAALTVAVFTVGMSAAASTWRTSVAATQVGAGLSFPTTLPINRAVGLTQRLDPDGRWLMAAAVNIPSYDFTTPTVLPRVVVDTSRLARVASWPSQWTQGRSAASVARALGPRGTPVILKGRRLSVTVTNHVRGDYPTLGPTLEVLDDRGDLVDIATGPFPHGRSTATTRLQHCDTGCRVESMAFGGPDALVEAMSGSASIDRFEVDGHVVPGVLDRGWHVDVSPVGARGAVVGRPVVEDGRLTVHLSAPGPDSYAALSPDDTPRAVPLLWGRTATQVSRLSTGSGGLFPVQSAGTAESMPFRGPSGMLLDFTSYVRNASVGSGVTQVYILARTDTPRSVRRGLAARGMDTPETQAAAKHVLDQDAFALALRLYAVVAALVIALAVAGLAATLAVQVPARRRDAASLRVVGLGRRPVMAAVVSEFMLVLGSAALAGILAGGLAQYVVVRSVTLGISTDALTPRPLPSFHVTSGARLSAVVLLALLVASAAFALLTVRSAQTASLRENAR